MAVGSAKDSAIGSPKFDNIGNKRSGTKAVKATLGREGGELGLYVDDNSFKGFYKSSVNSPNPVADSLKSVSGAPESEHVQPYINKFKTVDLCYSTKQASTSIRWDPNQIDWGNWRSWGNVHKAVFLQTQDMNIEMSIQENYDNLWDTVMGNKVVSLVDSAATNTRMFSTALGNDKLQNGEAYPKYKNVLVLKDISAFGLPNSFTFIFNYGSAGLFSCEEEVVRPIIALAKLYAPTRKNKDDTFVEGIVPSNEYALSKAGKLIVEYLKNNITNNDYNQASTKTSDENNDQNSESEEVSAVKGLTNFAGSAAGKVADFLTKVQSKIYLATNDAARDILNSDRYKFVTLRMGRLVLPSMVPQTIKWKFDFSQVDEYGFPYKGEFTFDGLQTPEVADNRMIGLPNS